VTHVLGDGAQHLGKLVLGVTLARGVGRRGRDLVDGGDDNGGCRMDLPGPTTSVVPGPTTRWAPGTTGLRYTAPDGVKHKDYGGEVLG
jgi:hypothetical protein